MVSISVVGDSSDGTLNVEDCSFSGKTSTGGADIEVGENMTVSVMGSNFTTATNDVFAIEADLVASTSTISVYNSRFSSYGYVRLVSCLLCLRVTSQHSCKKRVAFGAQRVPVD